MTAALTERMPAAQLIGQANDLFSRFMDKTELNFRWLQEILVEAKESFQQ